jgi:hypothetical protein
MPSHLHEALVLLFRHRPALAPDMLRDALRVDLPTYSDVRLDAADLTNIQPAEYRADLVVLLLEGKPVYGIVVEVQLSRDERKRFVWPAYVANLRAKLRCPVCLLVVAASDGVACWAAQTVEMGAGSYFTPLVLGPSGVPKVTDELRARADPELAVLSTMAHGRDADTRTAVRIAQAALAGSAHLDEDRSKLYFDLIMSSINAAARLVLQAMDMKTYQYQSEFARRYHSQGIAEGHSQGEQTGRAALVIRLLEKRFGSLTSEVQNRIITSTIAELDAIAERLLTASTLQQALGTG